MPRTLTILSIGLLAACIQLPGQSGPQTVAGTTYMDEVRTCGYSLGVAGQCNFVQDINQFDRLRTLTLTGLTNRAPAGITAAAIRDNMDAAALSVVETLESCSLMPRERFVLAAQVRNRLQSCAGEI